MSLTIGPGRVRRGREAVRAVLPGTMMQISSRKELVTRRNARRRYWLPSNVARRSAEILQPITESLLPAGDSA